MLLPYVVMVAGKRRQFDTLQKLERTLGVTADADDISRLQRAAQKGDVLFVSHNPYDSEMASGEPDAKIGMLIAETQEALDKTFYQLREEI